ncbi:MAG: hypothetical protein EPO22_11780 [Dehalococcoidia bacterium]|nr:MAG: hypothetical protein EPO22_11780 [Dehalococcoidia bacterium]
MSRRAVLKHAPNADVPCERCGRPARGTPVALHVAGSRPVPLRRRSGISSVVAEILQYYSPDDVNWSEIAHRYNVSRQAVHQCVRRLIAPSSGFPVAHPLAEGVPLRGRRSG